jgi:hypothetical protein
MNGSTAAGIKFIQTNVLPPPIGIAALALMYGSLGPCRSRAIANIIRKRCLNKNARQLA